MIVAAIVEMYRSHLQKSLFLHFFTWVTKSDVKNLQKNFQKNSNKVRKRWRFINQKKIFAIFTGNVWMFKGLLT